MKLGEISIRCSDVLFFCFCRSRSAGSAPTPSWVTSPWGAPLEIFVFAVVAAIVVFLIGIIAALVVKDIGSPSSRTLTWALFFALVAAALWQFGPQLPLLSEVPWNRIPATYAVLAGAILGYSLRR